MHVYAASAALGCIINLYCPPAGLGGLFQAEVYNRRVVGRAVGEEAEIIDIMWSKAKKPKSILDFIPNHFAPLLRVPPVSPLESAPLIPVTLPSLVSSPASNPVHASKALSGILNHCSE